MDLDRYRYVSISGGGMQGRYFFATKRCVDARLTELHGVHGPDVWWDRIEGISGCSVGAIVALTLLLRVGDDDVQGIVDATCRRSSYLQRPDLGTLMQHFGLDEARGLYDLTTIILQRAGLSDGVTFRELKRYSRKDLVVVATNVARREKLYLCADTFPEMQVREAVVASCRIPFLYAPIRISPDVVLIDGGLTENQPVYFPVEETLNWAITYLPQSGFTFAQSHVVDTSPIEYMSGVFACVTANQRNSFAPEHTLCVFCPGRENDVQVLPLEDSDPIGAPDEIFMKAERFVADQLRGKAQIRLYAQVALIVVSLLGEPAQGSESA